MKIGTHQKSTMFSLSDRLYRIDQVPDHFKELFIFSGYRSPKSSPQQCVFSIFLPTNETFNFWTHFLPAVYFWFETWRLWYDLGVEPYTFPMMAYMLCLCVFPLTSAVAHVFNCLSDTARHICFFFDYAALSLYSLGAAIAYRAYVFPESLLSSTLTSLFLPIAIFNTFASLILSCETRFMEDGPWKKLFRILAYAVPYFFDSIPVFYRIFTTSFTDLLSGAVAFHLRQFMFTGMAAFVYVTHLPERLYPGSFDIIGHSHQLFHICTVFGSSDQMKGLLLDSQERREVLEPLMADLLPEPTDGIIYVFSIFFTTSLILAYFIYKLYKFKRMGRPMSRCGSFLDAVQLQLIANGAVAKGVAANGDRWQGEKYQQKKD